MPDPTGIVVLRAVAERLNSFLAEYDAMTRLKTSGRLTLKDDETPLSYAIDRATHSLQYEPAGRYLLGLLQRIGLAPRDEERTGTAAKLAFAEKTLRSITTDAHSILVARGKDKSFKTAVERMAQRAKDCLKYGTEQVFKDANGFGDGGKNENSK